MAMKNAWTMPAINLAGISLFEEFDTILSGYYACVVLDSEDFTSKGDSGSNGASAFPGAPGAPAAPAQTSSQATSVLFRLKINEQGSEAGKVASAWIGREPKEGNLRRWKSLYASCGYPLPNLEQAVTPHPSHFAGKQCFIHYVAPPVAEGQKVQAKDIQVNFITQDQYVEHKRQEQQAPKGFGVASATPSMPGAVSAPAPISFGGPNGGQQQPAQQPQYQQQPQQPVQYQPYPQAPPPQQPIQPQYQPVQQYAPAPMAAAPPPPAAAPQAQPIAPAPPLTAPVPQGYGAAPSTLYETPPAQQPQQPSAFAPPPPGQQPGGNVVPIYQQPAPQGPPQPVPGSTLFGPPPTA